MPLPCWYTTSAELHFIRESSSKAWGFQTSRRRRGKLEECLVDQCFAVDVAPPAGTGRQVRPDSMYMNSAIGGLIHAEGSKLAVDGVLVGERDEDGTLIYVGSVKTGLSGALLAKWGKRLKELKQAKCPFSNLRSIGAEACGVVDARARCPRAIPGVHRGRPPQAWLHSVDQRSPVEPWKPLH